MLKVRFSSISNFYSFDLLYDLGFYLFIFYLDLTLSYVSFILGLPKVCLLFFYLKFSVLSIFVIVACHMFGEIPLDMCCVIMCFKFGHQLIKLAVTLNRTG
jgi:hypothetical protein